MNIRYKIDKDAIFVTDEMGTIRKIPKYFNVEQILILENEVAAIDELIKKYQNDINYNKSKKSYQYADKAIVMVTFGCLLFGGTLVHSFPWGPKVYSMFIAGNVSIETVGMLLTAAIGVIQMILGMKIMDSGENYRNQNEGLSRNIDLLQKIKDAKERQVAMMKNLINSNTRKEETAVPIRQLSQSERLHEIANLIGDNNNQFTEETSICQMDVMIETIQETIQQKAKQKVLKMR